MEEKNIYSIIFDWGGVCFSDGTKKFINNISTQYNIPFYKIDNLLNGKMGSLYRSGKISKNKFWSIFMKKLKINNGELVDFSEQWNRLYEPNYEILKLLGVLNKNHYDLYYISDNVEDRVSYLKQYYGILDLFKGGIFSYEIGCRKPDILIYKKILDIINTIPQKCLYVDDKIEFLKPAKSLGMKTIHFKDADDLCTGLKQYGINCE